MLHISDTLSPRESRFVDLYVTTGNASRAAREAGYPEKSAHVAGCRLLKTDKVRAAIDDLRKRSAEHMMIDRERAIQEIQAAVELARVNGDASTMISGWREIGKMLGFYEPEVRRIDLSLNGSALAQQIRAMTDAEVLRLADSSTDDTDSP